MDLTVVVVDDVVVGVVASVSTVVASVDAGKVLLVPLDGLVTGSGCSVVVDSGCWPDASLETVVVVVVGVVVDVVVVDSVVELATDVVIDTSVDVSGS